MKLSRNRKTIASLRVTEKDGTSRDVVAIADLDVLYTYVNAMIEEGMDQVQFLHGLITIVSRVTPATEKADGQ